MNPIRHTKWIVDDGRRRGSRWSHSSEAWGFRTLTFVGGEGRPRERSGWGGARGYFLFFQVESGPQSLHWQDWLGRLKLGSLLGKGP